MKVYLGISTKLIFMATVCVFIAVGAVMYVATDLFRQESVVRVQEMNKDLAESLANQTFKIVEKTVEQEKVVFQTVVQGGKVTNNPETLNLAQNILRQNDDLIAVGLYKLEENNVLSEQAFFTKEEALAEFDLTLDSFKQTPLKRIMDNIAKDKWTEFFILNTSNLYKKPILNIVVKIADPQNPKLNWVVRSDIRQEALIKIFSKKLPTTSYWADSEGNILVHASPEVVLKNYNFASYSIFQDAKNSKMDNGQTEFYDTQGTSYLGAFRKLKLNNSVIISQLESSYALAAINQVEYRSGLVVLMALGLAFIFNFMFSKSLTSPLRTLYEATEKISKGQFDIKLTPQSSDEIGALTLSFSKMALGLQERDKLKSTFNKFHSKEIAQKILTGEVKLGGEKKVATVFFSDIRGFTTMAESMSPDEVVHMLNEYMTEMVKIIQKHRGVVDKYVGDAIMALWGVPEASSSDAENCVKAALEMRHVLIDLNKKRVQKGKPEIKIGIGIHTGEVLAGNIGSEERLEYTVIGDTVNQASRLESANKDLNSDILISETTYTLVKNSKIVFGPALPIRVKGKTEKVVVHQLIGMLDSAGKVISDLSSEEQTRVTQMPTLLATQILEKEKAPPAPGPPPAEGVYQMDVMAGTASQISLPPRETLWYLVRDVNNQQSEGPYSVLQMRMVASQVGFNMNTAFAFKEGDPEMIPLVDVPGLSRRSLKTPSMPQGVQMPSPFIQSSAGPSEWYVYGSDTQTYGPYTIQQLEQAVYNGSLSRTSYVWKQGMPQWMYLHQIPGFNRRNPAA